MKKRFATACILFVCLVSIFSCANSIDTITANNPTPTVYTVSFNTNVVQAYPASRLRAVMLRFCHRHQQKLIILLQAGIPTVN